MTAAPSVTLYELSVMRAILDEWLAEGEGELTPELESLLAEHDERIDTKIERVALFIRERKAQAAAVKEERDRLDAMAKRELRAAASLTDYLEREMTRLGRDRVNGVLCTVSLQKNPPSVTGEPHLPLENLDPIFTRHVPASWVLDKKAVIEAAKDGRAIPAGLWVEQGVSVRIR